MLNACLLKQRTEIFVFCVAKMKSDIKGVNVLTETPKMAARSVVL